MYTVFECEVFRMKSYSFKAIVFTFAIILQLIRRILIGVFGGKWIDSKLQTGSFFYDGLAYGLALSVSGLVYLLKDQIQGD